MACDFEYCVYDPVSTQPVIRYSNNAVVPGSIVEAVHTLCPESIGQKFVYLTKYVGNDSHVRIPSEIQGISVRALNCFSLKKHASIKEIDIPETVCLFHKNALKGCIGLEKINIASDTQILYISADVLRNCKKLFCHGVYVLAGRIFSDPECDEIVEYTIPQGVHTISAHAFEDHKFLRKVTIPDSVKIIEEFAFSKGQELQSVEIHGAPIMKDLVFFNCEKLNDIVFEQAIYHAGSYMFAGCHSLRYIQVPYGIRELMGWFDDCKALRDIILPPTLENISYRVFAGCRSLQYLDLPPSVNVIANGAFDKCMSLQKVLIRSKNIVIEKSAFVNCPWLTLEAFPDIEKVVASSGFDYSIIESDPSSYVLRSNMYKEIPALEVLNADAPLKRADTRCLTDDGFCVQYDAYSCGNALTRNMEQFDLYTAEKYYLTKEDVADRALLEDPEMGTDAYYWAEPAIDSTAPKLTDEIYSRYHLFWKSICSTITQPDMMKEIIGRMPKNSNGQFRDNCYINIACSGIVEPSTDVLVLIAEATGPMQIQIKAHKKQFSFDELRRIEEDIFATCPNLFVNTFRIAENLLTKPRKRIMPKQEYDLQPDVNPSEKDAELVAPQELSAIIESKAYRGQPIESFSIPEGVVEIGAWAFEECNVLTKICLPSTLQKIGVGAFRNCSSLKSIDIPENVSCIEDGAFENCTMLEMIALPRAIKKVSDGLFEKCTSLHGVVLPPNLEHIGARAFSHCHMLQAIDIPQTVKHIEYSAFSDCTSICEIQLPNALETLQGRVFKGCNHLRQVVIPNGISSIGKRMFLGCTELVSVDLPNSIVKIGENAFEGCLALEEIILPDSVACVENKAFLGCINLKKVILPGNISKVGTNIFMESKSVTIYIKGEPSYGRRIQKEGWEIVRI